MSGAGRIRRAPRGRQVGVRPGLLELYLLRGLVAPFLLSFSLITAAMMLERALRLAQEMAASGAHLGLFFPILAQLLPYYLGLALPVSFMIALVVMLSDRDEALELEAMLASGISLSRMAIPLMFAALAVAAATLVANGFLEPKGRYGFRLLSARALEEARISDLRPLAFYRPANGVTMSFERIAGGRAEGLFLQRSLPGGGEEVLTARSGALSRSPSSPLIRIGLDEVTSYDGAAPAARRRPLQLTFLHYRLAEPIRLPGGGARPRGNDQKELTLSELVDETLTRRRGLPPAAVGAELHSRIARSFSVLLLPLLALSLALSVKKEGRGLGLGLAGILLIFFHHAVNFTKKMTLDGSPPPALAFGLLEAALGALVLWLFVASRNLPSHGPLTPLNRLLSFTGRPRPARPASRLRLPGGTLAAYAAGRLALWIGACAVGLTLTFQMVDMVEHGDDFVERGFDALDMARYALLRLPLLLQQVLPMATLAGSMLALLRLSRFSETVALRAAGVSLARLSTMLLPIAAVVASASFVLAEYAIPSAEAELAAWWRESDPRPESKARWFRIGGEIASAQGMARRGGELRGIRIYRRDSGGRLTSLVSAETGRAVRGGWQLAAVSTVRLTPRGPERTRSPGPFWPARFGAAEARALFAPVPHISPGAARRALAGEAPVSEGPARFETRLQRRFAEPLAPLVMLILAIPLALASSHSGPSWALLLYPIAAGVAFVVGDGVLAVAAAAGVIAPWIGAWAAPSLFGLLGITVAVYSDG
jgi:lipopolysaccharide export system permease protein